MKSLPKTPKKEKSKIESMLIAYKNKNINTIKQIDELIKAVYHSSENKNLMIKSINLLIEAINNHKILGSKMYNDLVYYSIGIEYYQDEYRTLKKEYNILEHENYILKRIVADYENTKAVSKQCFTSSTHLKIIR